MSLFDDVVKLAKDNPELQPKIRATVADARRQILVAQGVATGMSPDVERAIPGVKDGLRRLEGAIRADDPVETARALAIIARHAGDNLSLVTGLGKEGNVIFEGAMKAMRKLP